MGLSRVYADEHWVTDVLAGMTTGSAVAAIAAEVFERTNERPNGSQTGTACPALPEGKHGPDGAAPRAGGNESGSLSDSRLA